MKIDPAAVRTLRESRAWSQEQLAEVAGLSVRTVQRIESGGAASLETRMALAAALDVEPADLCVAVDPQAGGTGQATGPSAGDGSQGGDERAYRIAMVGLGIAIVFALFLLFGYSLGRDVANKENRKECIAEGRTDCR